MTYRGVLLRALKLRCPRCGEGRLFRGLLAMNDGCAVCGLSFHPEPGYFVGAMYINYAATAVLGLSAGLLLVDRVPMTPLTAGLAAFGLVFPVFFFRYSRSLWFGLQRHLESRTQD